MSFEPCKLSRGSHRKLALFFTNSAIESLSINLYFGFDAKQERVVHDIDWA